jgi:histidyl-tRNA synthetase
MEREGRAGSEVDRKSGAFVVAIGDDARREGRTIVQELRSAGYPAEVALEDRPLKAQLKMADRSGHAFALIIGEQEMREGTVTVRDMAKGAQEQVKRVDVVSWLTR